MAPPHLHRVDSAMTVPSSTLEAYEPLEIIGSGTFGVIRKVRRIADGRIFARKELNFERMSERDRRQIISEVNILRTLTHTNIVRYQERFVDQENGILYIVMEYCEGGDLGSTIKECRRQKRLLAEEIVVNYLAQMIQGLDACHNAPPDSPTLVSAPSSSKEGSSSSSARIILHRDLKPENIFLDAEQTIKIGDFGLSKEVAAHSFACTYVGTPYYMSPELAVGSHYDVKSDIWALGCVAYELCGLRPPFDATTQAELTRKIQLGHVPELPRGYSRSLADMIRSMLQLSPAKRPTTRMLLQNPLIRLAIRRREEQRQQQGQHLVDRASLKQRELSLEKREAAVQQRMVELERQAVLLKEREQALAQKETELQLLAAQLQGQQEALEQQRRAMVAITASPEAIPVVTGHHMSTQTNSTASTNTVSTATSTTSSATTAATSTLSASLQAPRGLERMAMRRGDTMETNVASAGLRRLAARRQSAQRMHSSPCVVMGSSPLVDNSDVSMRDASAWMAGMAGNNSSGCILTVPEEQYAATADKENRGKSSSPLRSRRSSPAKVFTQGVLRPMASSPLLHNHAMNLRHPRSSSTNGHSAPLKNTVAAMLADEESLPSPFLRKMVRIRSQPAAVMASAPSISSVSSAPSTVSHMQTSQDPFAIGVEGINPIARHTTSITTTTTGERATNPLVRLAQAGAAREKAAASALQHDLPVSTGESAKTTVSPLLAGRRMSALPRKRSSLLPGSIGVAPLGRKSGELAIPLRG